MNDILYTWQIFSPKTRFGGMRYYVGCINEYHGGASRVVLKAPVDGLTDVVFPSVVEAKAACVEHFRRAVFTRQ